MDNTKKLIFDGIDLSEYGVFISGDSVYNAPERDVEMVDVYGRNGQLTIDHGRYSNIEVTYPAFIFADSQTEFAEKVRNVREILTSQIGYKRISDTYHPDEFRMGVYKSGLEVEPVFYNQAGEFELVFDCKPQRFLTTGEEISVLGNWGTTQTASGSIATFDAEEGMGLKSLVANIDYNASGVQSIKITRTSKNLGFLPQSIINQERLWSGLLWNSTSKSSYHVKGTSTALTYIIGSWTGNYHFLPKGTYTLTASYTGTVNGSVYIYGYDDVNTTNRNLFTLRRWNVPQTLTLEEDTWYVVYVGVAKDKTVDADVFIQIEQGTGTEWVSCEGEYISKELGVTVYGGTLDLISGVLTSTLNADGTTKAEPEVIQLSAESIPLLIGENNIWADSGSITAEYGADPNLLINPTEFEARPLVMTVGAGSLFVDDNEIVISANTTKFIDSESMEVYSKSGGEIVSANDKVAMTEFPVLKKESRISWSGLSNVAIEPRWWRI